MSLFCRKLVEITPKKRPFLWSFGYWASIFNLKNKDRFEHEIVLKILTKSEPRCSYKIVLIKKKRVYSIMCIFPLVVERFSFLFVCWLFWYVWKWCVGVDTRYLAWPSLADCSPERISKHKVETRVPGFITCIILG